MPTEAEPVWLPRDRQRSSAGAVVSKRSLQDSERPLERDPSLSELAGLVQYDTQAVQVVGKLGMVRAELCLVRRQHLSREQDNVLEMALL